MQQEYECYFFIADWHSLTTHSDTKTLQQNIFRLLGELIAAGLDPEKSVIYIQSDIRDIAELYLYLNMLAYKGELEKTATFKDKARQQPQKYKCRFINVSRIAGRRYSYTLRHQSSCRKRPGAACGNDTQLS